MHLSRAEAKMMKAARERLGLSLAVSTATSGDGGRVQHQRKIESATEEEVAKSTLVTGLLVLKLRI